MASLARAALRGRFQAAPRGLPATIRTRAAPTASHVAYVPTRAQNTAAMPPPGLGMPILRGATAGKGPVVSRAVDREAALRGEGPLFYEPKWWSGTPAIDPELFTIDCSGVDMADPASAGAKDIAARQTATYKEHGVVVLTGTGLGDSMATMRDWGCRPMAAAHKYEGGANFRGELVDNVYDTGAPASAHLHYHHEMAYIGESTSALAFVCEAAAGPRGDTYLSCSKATTEAIMRTEVGRNLKAKGVTYIRCLTDEAEYDAAMQGNPDDRGSSGVYNHWQRSFMTSDPAEAEAKARAKGLEVEWGPGRYMRTKYTISAFEYDPATGRNGLYSSVADDNMWFDTWRGVAEMPLLESFAEATPAQRPLRMTYGDGSEFSDAELRDYTDAYDAGGIRLRWHKGDVLTVCNKRFAHGRPAYQLLPGERRELGVVIGPLYQRLGARPEGW